MPKMLIDCDAFFASCEQAVRPRLRGKKVIVAGDLEKRSVVTAASYEAKALGVKAGMPIQEARRIAPDAVFVNGNIRLYLDFNLKLFKKLLSYAEPVEIYSVDEFYIEHRGSFEAAQAMAEDFKAWTRRELGITVSVGIAPTKVFAKLASEMRKPDGLTIILPEELHRRTDPLPVKELFGVGPSTLDVLHRMGIKTIGDLRRRQPQALIAELGVRGQWLYDAAQGIGDEVVKVVPDPFKSMGHRMTLPEDTADPRQIRAYLLFLADTVAHRLRADGSAARTVHLHVRYEDFVTEFSRCKTLGSPVFLADHLMLAITFLWEKYYQPGRPVRLLGIGCSNLERSGGYQMPLFSDDQRSLALSTAMDAIGDRFGPGAIGRASLLTASRDKSPLIPTPGSFTIVPGSGRRPL